MKGNILGFDAEANAGAISGYDGQRYDFVTMDWHGERRPQHGDIVDFVPNGQRATSIYVIEPEYVAPSFAQFYLSPRGRISRSQYWLRFFLPVFVISLILDLVASAGGHGLKLLPSLFQLAILWPGIAVLIKRIHDRNKSGALVWALYAPFILTLVFAIAAILAVVAQSSGAASALGVMAGVFGVAVLVVGIWFFIEFGCMRGTIGVNAYGPDPVR